mgnify:CR=1 FL=1
MTRILKIVAIILFAFTVSFCSDDDSPTTKDLTLNISGLENLGSDYVYEGWIIVNGAPISTGKFSVNDTGDLSQTNFNLNFSFVNFIYVCSDRKMYIILFQDIYIFFLLLLFSSILLKHLIC